MHQQAASHMGHGNVSWSSSGNHVLIIQPLPKGTDAGKCTPTTWCAKSSQCLMAFLLINFPYSM
eukprot:363451-Chlamydomonas_euryale.AAC.3